MIPVGPAIKTFYKYDRTLKIVICQRTDTQAYTFIEWVYEEAEQKWRRLVAWFGECETVDEAIQVAKDFSDWLPAELERQQGAGEEKIH